MNSDDAVTTYLAARRARGVQLRSGARALRQFVHETGNLPLDEVTPHDVALFLQGHGALSASWKTKYALLKGFYRFALTRGFVTSTPLPQFLPKLPPPLTPYVYSLDELQRLLDATDVLHSPWSPLQAATYRTLLMLLYGAGLRVSEAIQLTLRDVDLVERVLTVRHTKFHKSRLVPVGPQLAAILMVYLDQRCALATPKARESSFLCSRSGCRLNYQRIVTLFQRVRAAASIGCPPDELRPPRLHDLRHTAAVHRVLQWYRSGNDVQKLLPHLATYLGHVDITSTQRYLQMTPELLQEASCRFAMYAEQVSEQEANHA